MSTSVVIKKERIRSQAAILDRINPAFSGTGIDKLDYFTVSGRNHENSIRRKRQLLPMYLKKRDTLRSRSAAGEILH